MNMSILFANYKIRKLAFWLIVVLAALMLLVGLPRGANAADVTFVNTINSGYSYTDNSNNPITDNSAQSITGHFTFKVVLDPQYSNSAIVVNYIDLNTATISPLVREGINRYVIDPPASGNFEIQVVATSITTNNYNITFKNAALPSVGYSVSSIINTISSIPVVVNNDKVFTAEHNKIVSFSLAPMDGYIKGNLKVYYNSSASTYSTPLYSNASGIYTIPNIAGDIDIYVEGYDPLFCIMTLPQSVPGKFTVSAINGYDPNAVPYTGTFAFSIELADAYSYIIPSGATVRYTNTPNIAPTVTQTWSKNGKIITYTFTNVNGHLTFGIEHLGWSLTPHKITLPPSVAGQYLVTVLQGYDANNVANGSDFRFSVRLTSAYSNMTPVVYANGQQIYGDNYSGEYIFTLVNVTENKVLSVSLTNTGGGSGNAVYNTVTFAGVDATKIAVSPASGSAVLSGSSFTFTITPTAQYASNTVAPVVSAAGGVISGVKVGGSWQYTLSSVVADTTVIISIPTSWVQDTNVNPVTYNVAFSGTGFTVGNAVGGTSTGNLTYTVPSGGSFSFSINAQAGYNASTAVVLVNGMVLTPYNGIYSINNVNENKAVTVSFGGVTNDSAFKELTLTDASGISLTAMFSGNPRLVITPIGPGDKSYDGLKQYIGNRDILGAYDVSIVDGKYYGSIKIDFPVGVGYNTYRVYVLHGKVNGIDSYSPVVANGNATVTVSSLSPFIISDVAFSRSTGTLGGTGGITTGGTTILPPRTGDVIGKIGFALVGICSLALVAICLRNRARAKAEYTEGE